VFDDERDTRAPAWAWLRGFAYFLLAWPLLSLLALDEFELDDWQAILAAMLGPAAVGLVLLAIDWLLSRLFARRAKLAQTPPSTLRDLSNLGLCVAILTIVDVAIVTLVDGEQIFGGEGSDAATIALLLAAAGGGTAMVFRGLHRLAKGPARVVDLGEGWDRAPQLLRLFGYLTLIPTLLVGTVMIDYEIHQRSEFGPAAFVAIPILLWLGLRSAMARAPRWWARSPWEAWIRGTSLALPWWTIASVFGLGLGVVFLLLPTGLIDGDDMTRGGRIAAGVVGIPLGLIVLFGVGMTLVKGLPAMVREWRVARLLARRPEALLSWTRKAETPELLLRLADGREVAFDMGEDVDAMIRWLVWRRDQRDRH
jgi:hypothetical protein